MEIEFQNKKYTIEHPSTIYICPYGKIRSERGNEDGEFKTAMCFKRINPFDSKDIKKNHLFYIFTRACFLLNNENNFDCRRKYKESLKMLEVVKLKKVILKITGEGQYMI